MIKKAKKIVDTKIIPMLAGKTIIEVSIELDKEGVYPITVTTDDKKSAKFNVKNKHISDHILSILAGRMGEIL